MGEERVQIHMKDGVAKSGFEDQKNIHSVAESSATAPVLAVPSMLKPSLATLPLPITTQKKDKVDMAATTEVGRAAQPDVEKRWNTEKLGLRMGVDALSAGAAGALVAPVITMIDKGIIENASGRRSLRESLKESAKELLSRPHRFVGSKPFALIFSLYFGTYLTANTIDTLSSTLHHTPPQTTTSGTPKFLATSTANLALCLYKDNKFTQLFGSTSTTANRPVPLPTFALFTIRDCLTIFASFNLPPLLAPRFETHMSEGVKRYVSSASAAQFVIPAAVQVVSTPLHLLGLDLYNRPGVGMLRGNVVGEEGRLRKVLGNWGVSAVARMCRIVPAFGVGGVVNGKVRRWGMGKLEE